MYFFKQGGGNLTTESANLGKESKYWYELLSELIFRNDNGSGREIHESNKLLRIVFKLQTGKFCPIYLVFAKPVRERTKAVNKPVGLISLILFHVTNGDKWTHSKCNQNLSIPRSANDMHDSQSCML